MNEETDFGYQRINKKRKKSLVADIFSNVASKYDMMNNLMSFGFHHLWKEELMKQITDLRGSLIDVAGGTGDIAKLFYNKSKSMGFSPKTTLCDINFDMLSLGRDKLVNNNILDADYLCFDAENIPISDNQFDYYTIAFGIRNVTEIEKVLKESYRILKPGGKFICLEFGHVENNILSKIYDFYSFNIIPKIGKLILNDQDSYQYLVESIRKFPKQEEFLEMINKVGFIQAKYKNLSCGITSIYTGYKI